LTAQAKKTMERMMNFRIVSTAAAVALMSGISAAKADDSQFRVVISGEDLFQAGGATQKFSNSTRAIEFRNRFRFVVTTEAKTPNGLTYGGRVRMQTVDARNTTNTVTFDRAYVDVGGPFGTLFLGSHTSFNDDYVVARPNGYLIEDKSPFEFFKASNDPRWTTGTFNIDGLYPLEINVPSIGSKVRFDTASLMGFRASVSYTPRNDDTGYTFNRRRDYTTGAAQDVFEAAATYDNKDILDRFAGIGLAASVSYQQGRYDIADSKNIKAYQAGARAMYAGVTIGGGVNYYGKSTLADADPVKKKQYSYNFGAQYEIGPVVFGASHTYGEKDANATGPGVTRMWAYEAGLLYNLAPGLALTGEYTRLDVKNTAVGVRDFGNVFLVGTQVSF
jgi:outer membrane protein OmpU